MKDGIGRRTAVALGALGLGIAATVVALSWPFAPVLPASDPHPAAGYDEALARFRIALASQPEGLASDCHPRLLVHGHRTARVMVLLHGFTNCPRQFAAFADRCFARGDNVVLARMPEHGFADRHGVLLGRLGGDGLARATDAAIDLARGLGDSVVVVGLSVGGVAAAWAGQQRADVTRVVAIAPLFGIAHVPSWIARLLARLWQRSPDRFEWWDAGARERLAGPTSCYWGWSTRGLASMLRLSFALRARATIDAPRAGALVMVTNAHDHAVDNGAVRAVALAWAAHAPGRVRVWEFADSLHLGHDLIDPEQPYQRIELVYPVLERLTAGAGVVLAGR